jgi:hypothetical protein
VAHVERVEILGFGYPLVNICGLTHRVHLLLTVLYYKHVGGRINKAALNPACHFRKLQPVFSEDAVVEVLFRLDHWVVHVLFGIAPA